MGDVCMYVFVNEIVILIGLSFNQNAYNGTLLSVSNVWEKNTNNLYDFRKIVEIMI